MILETAINDFNEDIQRAKDLLTHATGQPAGQTKNDIIRASWMMAVGALDAYFCDAYGDLVARTFRAKKNQPGVQMPDKLKDLKISASVVLDNNMNDGWRWRMIARDLIEKDNVLSIKKIRDLFNHFFQDNEKLFNASSNPIDRWIMHKDSKHRLFGVTRTVYRNTAAGAGKATLKKGSLTHLEERFALIFQRRHDCIHNCDRPKTAIQLKHIRDTYVEKIIDDIEFVVKRCNEEFRREYPLYLTRLGFNAVTRNSVGV